MRKNIIGVIGKLKYEAVGARGAINRALNSKLSSFKCVLRGREALYEDKESRLVAKDDLPKSHQVSKH